ncbi:MAG TPA: hypothetical protein VGE79_12405 [Niastella sp.]
MKKILIPILVFASIVGYLSCQKEHSSDPAVAAEKTQGIKKFEPIVFSVDGANAQWAVSPGNAKITTNGNTATILFAKAGSYQVTANTGYSVSRITVNVSDTSWCTDSTRHCDTTITDTCRYGNCPPRDTIPHDTIPRRDSIYSLHNDQIIITPVKIDTAGVSGLLIRSITQLSYPCSNNQLLTNVIVGGNDTTGVYYTLKYTGVQVPNQCSTPSGPAKSTKTLFPVHDGTHVFKVILNGTTYTGSFTKTGSQYSFNWPYTSGVIISPQTIN